MARFLIFDLDQTLVDTSILEPYRRNRRWKEVYRHIPDAYLYSGMSEVFEFLRKEQKVVALVSSAPRPYIEKVVAYFNIPAHVIVGYHDAPRKPSPAPMLKALSLMQATSNDAITFGDRAIDICASKNAHIRCAACLWGSTERLHLNRLDPDYVLDNPEEIISLVRQTENA